MSDHSHSGKRYDYIDFSLEIREGGDHNEYVVAASSPEGEVKEEMRFPFDEWQLKDKLKEVEVALLRSMGLRRRIGTSEEETIREFGQALFEAAFVGDVEAYYRISLREARRQNKGLRLKLRVGPSELSALPWEFIYDPKRNYVGLSSRTPLVRYPDVPQPVEQLTVTPPLSILGMVTSPQGLPQLDITHEKRLVEEALKGLQAEGLVELTWLEGQTWNDLKRAMRRGPWHVFHFIGHGGFDPVTEEGAIALSDTEDRKHFLGANDLALLLDDHHSCIRLVFLNSCEGAKGSPRDPFSSTASTLVRSGIPAVVAMQYEVTDEAAIDFSRAFYEALADGLPVDAAVAEARTAIKIRGALEWGAPVLYMRSPNGRIFDIEQDGTYTAGRRREDALAVQESRAPADAEVRKIDDLSSDREQDPNTTYDTEREEIPGSDMRRRGAFVALAILLVGVLLVAGGIVGRGLGLFDGPPAAPVADSHHKQAPARSESHGHAKPGEPSGGGPFFATGPNKELPEKEGPLPPAEYKTAEFEPDLTFRITEDGWKIRHPEFSDVIGLKKGDMWLAFLNVQEVYPASKTDSASPVPAPKNMVAWLRDHDYLVPKDEHRIEIGGEPGIQFDHVDTLIWAEQDKNGLCPNISCLPLFLMHAAENGSDAGHGHAAMHMPEMVYALREGESARIIVVPNVAGENVVILMQGDHEALEQSLPDAENLLDTVQWQG